MPKKVKLEEARATSLKRKEVKRATRHREEEVKQKRS